MAVVRIIWDNRFVYLLKTLKSQDQDLRYNGLTDGTVRDRPRISWLLYQCSLPRANYQVKIKTYFDLFEKILTYFHLQRRTRCWKYHHFLPVSLHSRGGVLFCLPVLSKAIEDPHEELHGTGGTLLHCQRCQQPGLQV